MQGSGRTVTVISSRRRSNSFHKNSTLTTSESKAEPRASFGGFNFRGKRGKQKDKRLLTSQSSCLQQLYRDLDRDDRKEKEKERKRKKKEEEEKRE